MNVGSEQHSKTILIKAVRFLWNIVSSFTVLLVQSLFVHAVAVASVTFKYTLCLLHKIIMEAVDYIPLVVLEYNGKRQKRNIISPFLPEIVEGIEKKAEKLVPSRRFIEEGKQVANNIFEKLKKEGRTFGFKVARTKIAGSFNKGTGISFTVPTGDGGVQVRNPDLDLVVLINEHNPPFKNVFESFKKILENMPGVRSVQVKQYTVKLVISTPTQGDIEVDLLAATNLAKNTMDLNGEDVGNVEAYLAFNILSEEQVKAIRAAQNNDLDKNNKLFSSAFAEKTLDVIHLHVGDLYKKKIVLLAKYWNALVKMPASCTPAKSCMIELVAIHTQRKAWRRERNGEKCVVCGFRRFLKAMKNLKTMNISLDLGMINSINEDPLTECEMPMIRDPVNSWNNFAQGLQPDVIEILAEQANKTLEVLEKYRKGGSYESVENAIDEIFCHKG